MLLNTKMRGIPERMNIACSLSQPPKMGAMMSGMLAKRLYSATWKARFLGSVKSSSKLKFAMLTAAQTAPEKRWARRRSQERSGVIAKKRMGTSAVPKTPNMAIGLSPNRSDSRPIKGLKKSCARTVIALTIP